MEQDDEASLLVRPKWLHRVANDIQILAGGLAEEPDAACIEHAFQRLPPPVTALERVIIRGLAAQANDAWRHAPVHGCPGRKIAVQARDILEARYPQMWTVAELARELGCNRTALEEAFNRLTHLTVHSFLVHRRVAAACELLVRTDKGLKTIAEHVGMSEPTLIRQCHRLVGLSPGEYRRRFKQS